MNRRAGMDSGGTAGVMLESPLRPTRTPYGLCFFLGLGGLVVGATGPLLSNFVPLLVEDVLRDHRTAIGAVMAIDNLLLLLLVPWAGAVSDRAAARGRGRMRIVIPGLLLAAVGMALLPSSSEWGIAGLIAAMIVLYAGMNVQRSPFQALVADLVPSRHRSFATGTVTFLMCVGAIVFLMLGKALGMQPAFLIAAGTVLAIAIAFAVKLREPPVSSTQSTETSFASLWEAIRFTIRGSEPGMRSILIASLFLQLTFQTFTTWYALHGTARFGVAGEDVTIGFIAWALGGVIGAVPAGIIGMRIGRRNTLLLGLGLMGASLLALDRVTSIQATIPLLVIASASWSLPTVNAFPLFIEPISRPRRGVLTALLFLCTALGGLIGDPLNGSLFDLFGGYRPLFLMMVAYTVLAFVAVLKIPRGAGEADTGPEAKPLTGGAALIAP